MCEMQLADCDLLAPDCAPEAAWRRPVIRCCSPFPVPIHLDSPAGVAVPAEHGGLGLGYLQHCIAMEELSRASGSGVLA